ncbi:MAG: hypothetical protein AAGU17_06465 [Anaerolineaceae bacterium]
MLAQGERASIGRGGGEGEGFDAGLLEARDALQRGVADAVLIGEEAQRVAQQLTGKGGLRGSAGGDDGGLALGERAGVEAHIRQLGQQGGERGAGGVSRIAGQEERVVLQQQPRGGQLVGEGGEPGVGAGAGSQLEHGKVVNQLQAGEGEVFGQYVKDGAAADQRIGGGEEVEPGEELSGHAAGARQGAGGLADGHFRAYDLAIVVLVAGDEQHLAGGERVRVGHGVEGDQLVERGVKVPGNIAERVAFLHDVIGAVVLRLRGAHGQQGESEAERQQGIEDGLAHNGLL